MLCTECNTSYWMVPCHVWHEVHHRNVSQWFMTFLMGFTAEPVLLTVWSYIMTVYLLPPHLQFICIIIYGLESYISVISQSKFLFASIPGFFRTIYFEGMSLFSYSIVVSSHWEHWDLHWIQWMICLLHLNWLRAHCKKSIEYIVNRIIHPLSTSA